MNQWSIHWLQIHSDPEQDKAAVEEDWMKEIFSIRQVVNLLIIH